MDRKNAALRVTAYSAPRSNPFTTENTEEEREEIYFIAFPSVLSVFSVVKANDINSEKNQCQPKPPTSGSANTAKATTIA
jgi:hypothetical protein